MYGQVPFIDYLQLVDVIAKVADGIVSFSLSSEVFAYISI